MMAKQKVITKLKLDDKKNDGLIRDKIVELKKEFKKYNESKIGEMYKILKEIVNLKRALPENAGVGKNYTMRSLEWEKDISLSAMEIRYISSYIFISDYAVKCVGKGLIHDSTICHFLAISSLLREEKWQNKLIDLVIARKIRICEVSELTKDELKLFLQGKLKRRIDDKYILSSAKTLRAMVGRLKQREHLLKNSVYRKTLLRSVNTMKKYLEGLE